MISPDMVLQTVEIVIKVNGEEKLVVSKKFTDDNAEKILTAFKQLSEIGK